MLTIFGQNRSRSHCDGFSRRDFIKIGGLSMGTAMSLSLADVLRAEAKAGTRSSHKAVINVFLAGGPPHQDMWDLKPDAPSDIRGEFKPIPTNVPGIEICEHFPKLAAMMDKAAIIRSIVGSAPGHDAFQTNTGWTKDSLQAIGGRPSLGAVVSKLQGPVDPAVPAFVGLAEVTKHVPWSDPGATGFLGQTYAPFKPDGPALANMKLHMSTEQLADRRKLLSSFDQLRRDWDATGSIAGVDASNELAFDVLTSSKLLQALDLSKEDPRVRARYGNGQPYKFQYDGAPTVNEHLLIARRLVEAGVRCVTLSYGRWDSHGDNFGLVRDHGPKLDQCLSALIEDLEIRGMLQDVTVVVWGEFGRTPRINPQGGRDHWPTVSCAFLAGGGMKVGQVIGSTNRLGEYAKDRPVHVAEVVATLYRNLGLDTSGAPLIDPTGRPQFLIEKPPIPELI
ncbi:MAG: hypothetical protein ABS79_00670 [Planctomycetes bacterium SCN 63-9]|nr:MAG: hypothetical protein ABS79_00670 [Planctomycetes bacterium SCN 63-9]